MLAVMLAYLVRRELSRAWAALDVTVEEGLQQLQTLCSTEIQGEGGAGVACGSPHHRSRCALCWTP
ncbi:MAG: hypothetical protein DMG57_44685 [Acidobacteria bacterium]|nr:MAG: hypothetical protein DMG57_44685 [Acidobacteriota bacterium]